MSWFGWLKAAAAGRGRLRLAAQVILLDPDDRVLMRYHHGPPNESHWTTRVARSVVCSRSAIWPFPVAEP